MPYVPNQHGPQAGTTSYADIIASDGTNVHVIRTITIVVTAGTARECFVSIGAGAAATEIVHKTVPATDTIVLNGWWVVPTSTAAQVKQGVGTDATFTVSGYHYT